MYARVEVEVTIPPNGIVYDVGSEILTCNGCAHKEPCSFYPPQSHDEPSALEARIDIFLKKHGTCFLKVKG